MLLNINRGAYMGSQLVWLHLALVTLKGQCQGHSDFEKISRKGAGWGYMLLSDTTRKQNRYGESSDTITFDLKLPWKVKFKVLKMI